MKNSLQKQSLDLEEVEGEVGIHRRTVLFVVLRPKRVNCKAIHWVCYLLYHHASYAVNCLQYILAHHPQHGVAMKYRD